MSHTNPVIEFSFADKESQEENTEKKETTCKRKISPNLYINCQNVRDWTPTFPRASTQHLLSLRWNVVENCSLPLAQALLMVSLETEPRIYGCTTDSGGTLRRSFISVDYHFVGGRGSDKIRPCVISYTDIESSPFLLNIHTLNPIAALFAFSFYQPRLNDNFSNNSLILY